MIQNKQLHRIAGKAKLDSQTYYLVQLKKSQVLIWVHSEEFGFDCKKRLRNYNKTVKYKVLPYFNLEDEYQKQNLLKILNQKHQLGDNFFRNKKINVPGKTQKIVGKAKFGKILHVLIDQNDLNQQKATWIPVCLAWVKFPKLMKIFNQSTKNITVPFVFQGYEEYYSDNIIPQNSFLTNQTSCQNNQDNIKPQNLNIVNKKKALRAKKIQKATFQQLVSSQVETLKAKKLQKASFSRLFSSQLQQTKSSNREKLDFNQIWSFPYQNFNIKQQGDIQNSATCSALLQPCFQNFEQKINDANLNQKLKLEGQLQDLYQKNNKKISETVEIDKKNISFPLKKDSNKPQQQQKGYNSKILNEGKNQLPDVRIQKRQKNQLALNISCGISKKGQNQGLQLNHKKNEQSKQKQIQNKKDGKKLSKIRGITEATQGVILQHKKTINQQILFQVQRNLNVNQKMRDVKIEVKQVTKNTFLQHLSGKNRKRSPIILPFQKEQKYQTKQVVKNNQAIQNKQLVESSKVIQIVLQCEEVTGLTTNGPLENLYRVIIGPHPLKEKAMVKKGQKLHKQTKFLLTSQMIEQYPRFFVNYLEIQIKKLNKKLLNFGNLKNPVEIK